MTTSNRVQWIVVAALAAWCMSGRGLPSKTEQGSAPDAGKDPLPDLVAQADDCAVKNRDREALDLYIKALGDHLDAEYILRRVDDLNRSTGDIARLCAAIEGVRFSDPWVRALALRERARLLWTMGRIDEAVALSMQLEPLTNWMVCGGFENAERTGLLKSFGPESDASISSDYEGKQWRVAWRPVAPLTRLGAIDLELVMPARWITVYLRTGLSAPCATSAVLCLDFPGAFRVWVNGTPAAQATEYIGSSPEMYRVPLKIEQGTNMIVVKLCAEENGARVYVRLASPDGEPLRLPSLQPADGTVRMVCEPSEQWTEAQPPPRIAALAAQWKKRRNDTETGLKLARYYSASARYEEAIKVFERVRSATTLRAADLYHMANAYSGKASESEAIAVFRDTLKADSNANAARVSIASHYINRRMFELAQPVLQEALAICSNDLSARQAMASLLSLRDWDEDAYQLAEETARLFGDFAYAQAEFARLAAGRDHAELAEAAARAALACSPTYGSARSTLLWLYERQRKFDMLEKLCTEIERIEPTDVSPFSTRADIAHALRDADRGLAICDRALAQFPDRASFHRLRGDFLHMKRDVCGAVAAYQHSLVFEPDDLHLRRYVDFLTGKSHAFFVAHTISDEDVRERITAKRQGPLYGDEAITETICAQDLVQLYEDGSSRRQHHSLIKALNARGVQVASSMDIPSCEVLRAVTHKKDGSVIEATHVKEGQIEFADVQVGDVVECRYLVDRYGGSWLEENYYTIESFEENQSPVRFTEFVLAVPTNKTLVCHVAGGGITSSSTNVQGCIVHRWQAKNVPMMQGESYMPPYLDVGKFVAVSTITNWDIITQWQQAMLSDISRGDHTVSELAATVVAGATTDAQRIERIFRYVVDNFRYTQMYETHIAGVKPHPVPNILANRCGDCKDLSLLTSELLKSIGIPAQLALVRTRNMGTLITNVPAPDVFNHIVVYLPSFGSNGWFVDPTFRHGSSDMVPQMDQDVCAIVVTGTAHRIVHIPVAPPEENASEFAIRGVLQPDGTLTGALDLTLCRLEAAGTRAAIERIDDLEKVGKFLIARVDPGGRVKKFVVENKTPTNAPLVFRVAFVAPTFGQAAEGKLTAKLPLPFKSEELLGGLEQRKYPLRLNSLQFERHTYSFSLPAGSSWDLSTTNVHLATPFGSFVFSATPDNDAVRVAWTLILTMQLVSTNDYPAFRAFIAKVSDTTMQVLTVRMGSAPKAEDVAATSSPRIRDGCRDRLLPSSP